MMTRSRHPWSSSVVNSLPTSPHFSQVCGKRLIASSASPRMPRICTPRPCATAASASVVGSAPLPAMMASGPVPQEPASGLDWLTSALTRRWDIVVRNAERAIGVRLDEVDDLPDEWIGREHVLYVVKPVHPGAFAREQKARGLAKLVDAFAGKAVALQSDDVEAREIGAVAEHHAEGNDILLHSRHAADQAGGADAPGVG